MNRGSSGIYEGFLFYVWDVTTAEIGYMDRKLVEGNYYTTLIIMSMVLPQDVSFNYDSEFTSPR